MPYFRKTFLEILSVAQSRKLIAGAQFYQLFSLFNRYNLINGFPYSNDKYRGEKFRFTVGCSVVEEEVE